MATSLRLWQADPGGTAMYRYKTITGRRLHARTLPNQRTEAKVACNALNKVTSLGMPFVSNET
jgi:hypothetical protein